MKPELFEQCYLIKKKNKKYKLSNDIVTGRGCVNHFCGPLKLDSKGDSPWYFAADFMTLVEH